MSSQCILFRANTSDRIAINASSSVQCVGMTKDTVTGVKDTFILRHPTFGQTIDLGPMFAGVNPLCLEDLNVHAVGLAATTAVIFKREGGPVDGIILWSGSIPAGKSLRYREATGFEIV